MATRHKQGLPKGGTAVNKKNRSIVPMYMLMFAVTGLLITLLLGSYVIFGRALPLYFELKSADMGWEGDVHVMDSKYGYVPVPNSQGAELVPFRGPLNMRYDQNGFRIPVSGVEDTPIAEGKRPIILTLGCSFTYGAATAAEETFPFLVGDALEATVRNAGRPSYGLSQMILLARELIPKIKPDIILVQYSPWLAERAKNPLLGLDFGKVGQPYYSGEPPELQEQPFKGVVMDLPVNKYRAGEAGVLDFLGFLNDVALPLAYHDGLNYALYRIRRALDLMPAPASDSESIERAFYFELADIAKEYEAKLVAVTIATGAEQVKVIDDLPSAYLLVDANKTLINRLPSPDREHWIRHYSHWAGDPPRPVDFHPNPEAHRIIAEEIVDTVEEESSPKDNGHDPS